MRQSKQFRRLAAVLALSGIAILLARPAVEAALCVWRKPDQDIKRFFPGADTYETEYKRPGSRRAAIEQRIGARLDADESEFKFYRILDDGKRVGTILTHLGKGQYGAIEVVVAVDNAGKVKGVGIQRDRERARQALRGKAFLDQFEGKRATDPITIGRDIEPAAKGAEKSSHTVAFSVKKLLVLLDELG